MERLLGDVPSEYPHPETRWSMQKQDAGKLLPVFRVVSSLREFDG